MSRGFTGSRSGSALPSQHKRHSAKDAFMKKMRGVDESKMTDEEKYKQIFDKKMDEMRRKALAGSNRGKYAFTLPGTENNQGEEGQLSKNMEVFLQRMAMKKAKEEQKKEKKRAGIEVRPQYFTGIQGGRIDKKGHIFGPQNQWIASVNMKTGRVVGRNGATICKYNPNSPYTAHQISQFIANFCNPNKPTFHGGANGHGAVGGGVGGVMDSFYGTGNTQNTGGMGSFYGNDDNNKGGGFWG